jgi:hypothetical protein
VLDPIVIDDAAGAIDTPYDNQVAVAYDGRQFMVAWAQRDSDGVSRVRGRFLEVSGEMSTAVPYVLSPANFRLSHRSEGDERYVALSPQTGGGFVAVWEEEEASNSGDSGISLRLAAFGSTGEQQFANQACDVADFRLDRSAGGNQLSASLAKTAGGSLFAMWTDCGPTEINQRGASEIRLVAIRPRDLLPIR